MKIKEITVQKELLLNLGNYSNIKISVSITEIEGNFDSAWKELNTQLQQQENLERSLRLPIPKPVELGKKWEPASDLPF